MALEMTVLRVLAQASKAPGPEASVLKVRGTEIQQTLTELMVEAAGPLALPFDPAYLEGETEHSGRRRRRRRAAGGALLQFPQDLHLRRLERDSTQHHHPDDPGPVRN